MPTFSDFSEQFERWAGDHVEILYRLAFRLLGNAHDAEDVLQDTFRSAWTSRHLYDESRSERAWLIAILRRRVADHWRRQRDKEVSLGGESPQMVAPPGDDPFVDELSLAMQRGLQRLATELRETLLLVVVGELTHQEAADLQGIPLGTVLSRVSRARTRLREFLLESDHAGRLTAAEQSAARKKAHTGDG
jgi:RNA polymerase sigma-70 factor (ECF subfamily)